MIAEQLELIEMTETDRLNHRIQACASATDNLRRGIFARHEALFKMYNELKDELEETRREVAILTARLNEFKRENFLPPDMPLKDSSKFLAFRF